MANRIRKNMITFYIDDEEKAVIREKMKILNMSNQSLYLRKMALEGMIIKVDLSDFAETCADIKKISDNVNQIAKRVNATNHIYADDVCMLKNKQEEIWQLLNSILSQVRSAKP